LEIASRARTRSAIPHTVHKIVSRVHRRRFCRVCDLGLYDSVFEMTPRARTRSAIPHTVHKIVSRVRFLQRLPMQ